MTKKKSFQVAGPLGVERLGLDIIFFSCLVTLSLTPSLNIDAFNPPKFAILVLSASYLVLRYWKLTKASLESLNVQICCVGALLLFTVSLLFNPYSFSERLFGFQGRNFGFVTLVALMLFTLTSYNCAKYDKKFSNYVVLGLAWTNLGVCLIFFLQDRGISFNNFNNDYVVFPSTLGNPNFLSAFLGTSVTATVILIFEKSARSSVRIACAILACYSLYVIIKSESIQGLFSLGVAFSVLLFCISQRFLNKNIRVVVYSVLGAVVTIVSIGFIGLGPLSEISQIQTLRNRFVYWEIAIRMFQDSPLFGKGFDSYSDYYREFVTPSDYQKLGGLVISDSPHNVFLDFFLSGGLFLGFSFIILVIFTGVRSVKFLTIKLREDRFNYVELAPFAIFISLLSVSLISPFQLGLYVWLPVLIGLLLGNFSNQGLKSKESSKNAPRLIDKSVTVFLTCSLICCNPFFALLPIITDHKFKVAVEEGDFKKLREVALSWPFSGSRAISIAQGFRDSTFNPVLGSPGVDGALQIKVLKLAAEEIAVRTTEINGRQYEAWRFLLENSLDSRLKTLAIKKLRQLDPTNLEWKRIQ
jgi:O-antigen ligase